MTTTQRSIGKYRILGEIATGSFGRVYRGEDTSRQNYPVAIKLMLAAHLASAQDRHIFLQEAQLLTMLRHPFIVPVLDVGIENEFPYLVMEYAPNGSLYDRLKRVEPRPLPVKESLKMLGQIGAALHYAHQQNVIHRDLKPANILFNAQGDALLADFGIATMLAASMKSGAAVGTPYYMAPEQFRGTISKEGDQYALGCIAYEVMTGRLPFDAPDFFALGYKHMLEPVIPPTQLNLLIPYQVETAILKALAKQRTDRFPDVISFVSALGAQASAAAAVNITLSPTSPLAPEQTAAAAVPEPIVPDTPPISPAQYEEEDEDEEDSTLKRTRYMEEEGVDAAVGQAVEPISLVVQEEEGQPVLFRGSASGTWSRSGVTSEAPGQQLSLADSLPRLVEAPRQLAAMPDVLPRVVEGPVIRTPRPGGMMARAGAYSEEAEGGSPVMGARVPVKHVEEEEVVVQNGSGARNRDPEEDLEGEDDTPGYTGVGTLAGPNGSAPWSVGAPPGAPGNGQKKRRRNILLMACILSFLLVLVGGGVLYAMTDLAQRAKPKPAGPASAKVTITPARTALDQTYTIDAVTGKPQAAKNQVQARIITVSEGLQSKTIPTTGTGTHAATHAGGTVTLFNNASAAQTVKAGTVIPDKTNTISVVTKATVVVPPPPSGSQWGTANVTVQAVQAGTVGNVATGDIDNACCASSSIVAINESPLTGGQNTSTFTAVSQTDLNNAIAAANQFQASESATAQGAIKAQVHSNEKMLGNINCTPDDVYNHKVGDAASSLTVSVSVTCSVEVYDQQGAQSLAASLLQTSVSSTPGEALLGMVSAAITGATAGSNGTIVLKVSATGTAIATFSDAQKLALERLIAGKSQQEAQDILVNQAGISRATVVVSGGDGRTLPQNLSRITIVVEQG